MATKIKKKPASKSAGKKVKAKKVEKKKPVKPAKKTAKKAVKKVTKKAVKKVVKRVAKKVAQKPVKKVTEKKPAGRPFPSKAAVAPLATPAPAVVEERRLVMPPPPRPSKGLKKGVPLKPIKVAPTPVVVSENEAPWTAAELKSIRTDISQDLQRLRAELVSVEREMDELIHESGEGAGDDQADAGTKTFEREHEMSLVINARDMVLQTERALERIDQKRYGQCEECGNSIGKARLQVFPRATLCMICKQKEERR